MIDKNIIFDKNDMIFLSILMKYKNTYEKIINKSLEYKLELNNAILENAQNTIIAEKNNLKKECQIIIIGFYDLFNGIFKYFNNFNHYIYENLDSKYDLIDYFGSKHTIKKIFSSEFYIIKELHYTILYFIAIMNPRYNLVRFESDNGKYYVYALVNLGYKNKLNFDKFLKNFDKISTK